MLRLIQHFIRRAYGDTLPTVEEWALHNANKATPDGIIAEHIIGSIAKDFDNWVYSSKPGSYSSSYCYSEFHDAKVFKRMEDAREDWCKKHSPHSGYCNRALINFHRDLKLTWSEDNKGVCMGFYVNGVSLAYRDGVYIVRAYEKLKAQLAEAKRVAAEAERQMKENEAKWNLVENLLGMKRNEFGALVPRETASG